MSVVIFSRASGVISRSRNLRGIIARSAKVAVARIVVSPTGPTTEGAGSLYVEWVDGAWCSTPFASYWVAQDWVRRRRSFKGVPVSGLTNPTT